MNHQALVRFACLACVVGLPVLVTTGCADSDPRVTVHSIERQQSFSQSFAAAYSCKDSDGDTDVVLIDDATRQSLEGTDPAAPVHEVMHIRVLWKPTRDMKSDHTSAFNATFHWYVMGRHPEDILEYSGTAMIVLEAADKGESLSIRNASLRPTARRGELRDPIGSATMNGIVQTTNNPRYVRRVLGELRESIAQAKNAPANQAIGAASQSPASAAQ